MQSLFDKISIAGLSGELLEKVQETRPTCSPNTINLALKDERPDDEKTPLRNYIRHLAEQMLDEISANEQTQPLEAAA